MTIQNFRLIEASKNRYNNIKKSFDDSVNGWRQSREDRAEALIDLEEQIWHFDEDSSGLYAYNKPYSPQPTGAEVNKTYYEKFPVPVDELEPHIDHDGDWTYELRYDNSLYIIGAPEGSSYAQGGAQHGHEIPKGTEMYNSIIEYTGPYFNPNDFVPPKTRAEYEEINQELSEQMTWANRLANDSDILISGAELSADPKLISKKLERTTIGVKIDKIVSHITMSVINIIIDEIGLEELINNLKSHPITGFIWDQAEELLEDCPKQPLFHPPVKDFLKSFSLDLCDPNLGPTWPKIVVPSFNWKFQIKQGISEAFAIALEQLLSDLLMKLFVKY